ncbi:MAG: hypothetical protein Q9162_004350 [Coniocarpon cinnabarinum]
MAATTTSHPDRHLHPVATGPAAGVVAAHQAEQPLKLYSGWFCPFVQRVWSVLEEKQIPYQYIEVNPYDKPESLLKLNPRGLVPTLEYEGKPLFESSVIMELLEEAYPNHGRSLLPKDLYLRARMRIWSDFFATRVLPAYMRLLTCQPSQKDSHDDPAILEKRDEFLSHVKTFIKEMDPRGPFFMGAEPTMIDFSAAPWAMRAWALDYFKHGSGIPGKGQGGADEQLWERWRTWFAAIESKKSVSGLMSDREHYIPIYQRYANNTAQSELAKSLRAGRGVP